MSNKKRSANANAEQTGLLDDGSLVWGGSALREYKGHKHQVNKILRKLTDVLDAIICVNFDAITSAPVSGPIGR